MKEKEEPDEISYLIKDYGLEATINLHEERISHAESHPRNTFFMAVIRDSKAKLITLKKLKNEASGI